MIRIAITLDDVLRAKTERICKVYQKYINPSVNFEELDFSTDDFRSILGFNSKSEYYKFLYDDYSFEIFGEAPHMEVALDKKLNLWHLELNDNEDIDEELELIITNPKEFNSSIPFTYFFLSKMATRVREIFLPTDSMDIWKKCDILITADPKLIDNAPNNKVCVKIKTPYNEKVNNANGLEFDSLSSFIEDGNNLVKVVSLYNGRK